MTAEIFEKSPYPRRGVVEVVVEVERVVDDTHGWAGAGGQAEGDGDVWVAVDEDHCDGAVQLYSSWGSKRVAYPSMRSQINVGSSVNGSLTSDSSPINS